MYGSQKVVGTVILIFEKVNLKGKIRDIKRSLILVTGTNH